MPNIPKTNRADYKHFLDIQTRWNDNDIYGHINNAVYYMWFDTLVNNFLIESGLLDPQTRKTDKTIGLVVSTACQYFAPFAYPETITVGLRAAKIGTSSVRYEIGLFKCGADIPSAEGHFVHVYVDANTRKPRPISIEMREKLEALI